MKVSIEILEKCIYGMFKSDGEEIDINVKEDFYNEYIKLEEMYKEMQLKLVPLNSEYHVEMKRARKERKIEALKKEIKELEGE